MYEFCNTCEDKGSKNCALPSSKVIRRANRRLVIAELGNGFLAIGAAASPNSGYYNDSRSVIKARDVVSVMNMAVEACVILHQAIETPEA